jgi:hypothetical protein
VFQLKILIVALLACISLQIKAAPVIDIYTGTVPVNDRSQPGFQQGMNAALLQVLVKASAEQPEKLARNPALAGELSNAERFAAQFLYKTQADVQADGSSKNQLYLQAVFPQKIIMGLLKKANVRFWPAQRLPVLVLPVMNIGGLVHMASVRDPNIAANLLQASQQYGIPMVMGGEQNEDAALLWNLDIAYINKLSAANADANNTSIALVIKLPGSGAAKGQWVLVDGSTVNKVDVSMDTPAHFADKGMAWAANILAAKQSVSLTSAASKTELLVSGIDSYEKYENAVMYLKTLSIVEKFDLLKIQPGFLSASLQLTTGIDQLEKVFQVDKKITVTASETGQKIYRWNE